MKKQADAKRKEIAKRTGGRPEEITRQAADRVIGLISSGMSARKASEACGFSIFGFLDAVERFDISQHYARAMYERASLLAEESLEIADGAEGADVQRDRLRVDTRKWFAARLDPKKWGDKIAAELTGKDGGPVQVVQKIERVIVDATD